MLFGLVADGFVAVVCEVQTSLGVLLGRMNIWSYLDPSDYGFAAFFHIGHTFLLAAPQLTCLCQTLGNQLICVLKYHSVGTRDPSHS